MTYMSYLDPCWLYRNQRKTFYEGAAHVLYLPTKAVILDLKFAKGYYRFCSKAVPDLVYRKSDFYVWQETFFDWIDAAIAFLENLFGLAVDKATEDGPEITPKKGVHEVGSEEIPLAPEVEDLLNMLDLGGNSDEELAQDSHGALPKE